MFIKKYLKNDWTDWHLELFGAIVSSVMLALVGG